jgi:hypothetical protein
MSEEFKDYYNSIMEMVVVKTNNIPYAKNLVNKNYFRIKTGFYEDENPDTIVEELVYQIKEHLSERGSLILEGVIVERSVTDQPVREIVRTLVNIIKSKETGTHYLPEDISKDRETHEYDFKKIPLFSIEFDYQIDYTINDEYEINAEMFDDETIIISLIINPKNYPQSMYDIVADLNDVVAHEIEHIYQNAWQRPMNELPLYGHKDSPTGKEYYKQPHEVSAELAGFRRINRLRKEPIEKTIRDWFNRNKNVHHLNDEDIDELTEYLTQEYNKKFRRD